MQMISHVYPWIHQVYTWSIYVVYSIYMDIPYMDIPCISTLLDIMIHGPVVYPCIYHVYPMYIGEDSKNMEYM